MSIEQRVADWRLFSDEKRASIIDDFNAFIGSDTYTKMSIIADAITQSKVTDELDPNILSLLSSTVTMNDDEPKTLIYLDGRFGVRSAELKGMLEISKQAIRGVDFDGIACSVCNCIEKVKELETSNRFFVNEDSLTAWVNRATELFHLTAGDIRAMKEGEQLEVMLFDRNLGDWMDGRDAGETYDPTEEGINCGTYTHKAGLSGSLVFPDYMNEDFTWEVNGYAVGTKIFWRPLNDSNCGPDLNESNVLDAVPIGWRGPCIRKSDALTYLPRSVTHYDTWYDDYVPYRYSNYLTME